MRVRGRGDRRQGKHRTPFSLAAVAPKSSAVRAHQKVVRGVLGCGVGLARPLRLQKTPIISPAACHTPRRRHQPFFHRKRNASTETTYTALRRRSCCTLCSRLSFVVGKKAASEAPQRGRGCRRRFCYSQLELAALQEVGGDAQKNDHDILPGRPRQSSPWTRQRRGEVRGICAFCWPSW